MAWRKHAARDPFLEEQIQLLGFCWCNRAQGFVPSIPVLNVRQILAVKRKKNILS
jgi:hypothetical protein